MAIVELRYDPKDTAWFTANAAMILKAGEPAYHSTTGLFKLGDGVTVLSALSFLPSVSGGSQNIQSVLTTGNVATTTIETTGFIKTGGTSSQFLKADGSVDNSTYQPILVSGTNIKTVNGSTLLGSGNLSVGDALVANPLSQFAATTSAQLAGIISDETGGSGVLVFNASPTFTGNIFTPSVNAGTVAGANLILRSGTGFNTGTITFGTTVNRIMLFDETTTRLGVGQSTPLARLHLGTANGLSPLVPAIIIDAQTAPSSPTNGSLWYSSTGGFNFTGAITSSTSNASGLVSSFTNTNSAGYVNNKSVNDAGKEIGLAVFGSTSAIGTLYDANTAWVSATADVTGIINEQTTGQIVFATGGFGASQERVRISTTVTKFRANTINIDNGTASSFMKLDASKNIIYDTTTYVSSVSGTTNRITSTGGSTPVIDISASYVGQSSITTVGALASGSITTGFTSISTSYTDAKIKGTASVSGGIPYQTATDTVTTNSNFVWSSANNRLNINGGSANNYLYDLNISGNSASTAGVSVKNISTAGTALILCHSSASIYGYIGTCGSTLSGNMNGTTIPLASKFLFTTDGSTPMLVNASYEAHATGSTSGSYGSRLDSVGFRVDTNANINTTNNNAFTVNGNSYFGANVAATALIHLAAGTTSVAQIRLVNGVAPTSPNNGDIWFDGTDIKMRISGVTKTFTLL